MQIRDISAAVIARTYTRQVGGGDGGAGRATAAGAAYRPRTDSLAMSNTRQEVMRVRDIAAAAPDVRADKVAAIRQQIGSGSYRVDNQAVAAQMLA